MLLKCSCLPCQKHAFGNISGLLSLSSLLSASDCQQPLLKQTNYFKRQFLLCLCEFGSLGEWRRGTVRKVDSMPMNKEGGRGESKSKTEHLPECHLCSQGYHFKIHLRSDNVEIQGDTSSSAPEFCDFHFHKHSVSLHLYSSSQNGAVTCSMLLAGTCRPRHTTLCNHNGTENSPRFSLQFFSWLHCCQFFYPLFSTLILCYSEFL